MLLDRLHLKLTVLATADGGSLTREIFGNIPPAAKMLFYFVAAVALFVFGVGCVRRVRLWMLGQPATDWPPWRQIARHLLLDVLFQRRVGGRGLASVAHVLLFSGFVVLLIGTTLIAIEHLLAAALGREAHNPVFHKGAYYAVFEVVMDSFGIAFLIGVVLFAWRRLKPPRSLGHNVADWLILVLLLAIGTTGYLIEGLRIIYEQTHLPGFSFVGLACARAWLAIGTTSDGASTLHFGLWWLHAVLALGLIAAFPYMRLWHAIAGAINLAIADPQFGVMRPVSMDELEDKGFVGVGKIEDFSRPQLIMMDACVSCGRCEEACPAFEAGKPLSPKRVVQDLRTQLESPIRPVDGTSTTGGELPSDGRPALHGDTIDPDTLWSCTTCSACVDVCPLGISPLGMITDMRRYLVGEAELRGAPATALQKSQRTGNPWGLPPQDRFQWADGLNVPTVKDRPDFDVLYWVGCAASYDRRTQKVARAVVRLLQAADVNFAVLGTDERCTGESARRMGDEFLFQELAESNLETLNRHNVKKILTHCPHCLSSFKHDYSQFGGHYEVRHHSEFLLELLDDGRLPVDRSAVLESAGKLTYHDPCYLARVNSETRAPRELIRRINLDGPQLEIIEMPRNGRNASCCGAGGGRMWFDDAPDKRVGLSRVQEALDTGATTVAVACPFCLTMMSDGIAARNDAVQVKDIAELLAEAIDTDSEPVSGS
jgi:Fe-S oxidoreductase/nitrate reductase gamma subunit